MIILTKKNTDIHSILCELYNYIYEIRTLYGTLCAIVGWNLWTSTAYIFDNGCTCLWMVDDSSVYDVIVLYLSCMRTANAIC